TQRRVPQHQPRCHCHLRRALDIEQLDRERAERIAQRFHERLGTPSAGGVDHEPAVHRIDPRAYRATSCERTGAQLLGHALLQLTHLPSSDWIALLLLELERAIGCDLADDGARQELLLDAK